MGVNVNVELNLSNYVDILKLGKKFYFSNWKSEVDKLIIDELKTTTLDVSKLSDAVKTEVVKKAAYDELVKNVKPIQTTDISNLIKKLTMTKKLVKFKRQYLIMIIVTSISLLKNLIS